MLSNSHLNLSPQAGQSLLTLWFLQDFNSYIRALIVWSKWGAFSYVLDLNCNKLPPKFSHFKQKQHVLSHTDFVGQEVLNIFAGLSDLVSQPGWQSSEDFPGDGGSASMLANWCCLLARDLSFSISIAAWVLTKWPLIFPENKWSKQTQGESHNVF